MKIPSINWGWRIVILYIIFMTGTIGWVTYTMSQTIELVRSDYYEHGLAHDSTMAAQARAVASGASIVFDHTQGALTIRVPAVAAASAEGSIALYRPNSIDSDRSIPLTLQADGTMHLPCGNLARGLWQFTLDWKANGLSYELVQTDTL